MEVKLQAKWLIWHGADLTARGGGRRTGRLTADELCRHRLVSRLELAQWLERRRNAVQKLFSEWIIQSCGEVLVPCQPLTGLRSVRALDQVSIVFFRLALI